MQKHILTIDRSLSIAWENLETMRIGFENAIVRLNNPTPEAQRFIELLRKGVQHNHLKFTQQHSGISPDEMNSLMATLAPVLCHIEEPEKRTTAPTLTVSVSEEHAKDPARFYQLFAQQGFEIAHNPSHADVVVHIERFLRPAQHTLKFHEIGTRHIPIRFADQHIIIGPLITPGKPLCLFCVELHELHNTPELAILAAQLCQKTPSTENEDTIQFAVHIVAAVLRNAPEARGHVNQLRFSVKNGVIDPYAQIFRVLPHPECSCAG